jgi:hypothetical protein
MVFILRDLNEKKIQLFFIIHASFHGLYAREEFFEAVKKLTRDRYN